MAQANFVGFFLFSYPRGGEKSRAEVTKGEAATLTLPALGVALVAAGAAGVEAGGAWAAVDGAATVFTGVEVPDAVPGGRPRFLAGPALLPSSIFLLLFRMTGGFTAGLSGFAFVLVLS